PSSPTVITPPSASLAPSGGGIPPVPRSTLAPPPASAPSTQAAPALPAGQVVLALAARFASEAPPITGGLTWRVYSDKPDANGGFKLVKEDKSAAPVFTLPAGGYVVHVGFGLANAVKAVQLRSEAVREIFELPAGGL